MSIFPVRSVVAIIRNGLFAMKLDACGSMKVRDLSQAPEARGAGISSRRASSLEMISVKGGMETLAAQNRCGRDHPQFVPESQLTGIVRNDAGLKQGVGDAGKQARHCVAAEVDKRSRLDRHNEPQRSDHDVAREVA